MLLVINNQKGKMFTISARVFELDSYVVKTFGVFSSVEKAKEAIDILVDRLGKSEVLDGFDDVEINWALHDYRSNFKIISLPDIDDLTVFQKCDLPGF